MLEEQCVSIHWMEEIYFTFIKGQTENENSDVSQADAVCVIVYEFL